MPNHPPKIRIQIVRLPHGIGLDLPAYLTPGSAGMDLSAAIDGKTSIQPGKRIAVPTGLAIAVPEGYEAQVRPRSGLSFKYGLAVLNAPGTVDSDYRGEIMIVLANLGQEEFTLRRGDRIAQLVISPVVQAVCEEVQTLPESSRGDGGFGHTGI